MLIPDASLPLLPMSSFFLKTQVPQVGLFMDNRAFSFSGAPEPGTFCSQPWRESPKVDSAMSTSLGSAPNPQTLGYWAIALHLLKSDSVDYNQSYGLCPVTHTD